LTEVICFLDTAAGQSTIDKEFAESLGLKLREKRNKSLIYLDRQVEIEIAKCDIVLTSQTKDKTFKLRMEAVENFAKNSMMWPWSHYIQNHPHLKDLTPPDSPMPPRATVLIGVDHPDLLCVEQYVRSSCPGRPVGQRRSWDGRSLAQTVLEGTPQRTTYLQSFEER